MSDIQRSEILLTSIIVHLLEFIETRNSGDLVTAEELMMQGDVYDLFKRLHDDGLLVLPRKPLRMLNKMLDA